ncbi:hypothetical protein BpHYR1_031935 [Brachionus plicatilis]|uniref:Uncharacterized protein n=1 Tax=Brachionus plicatilis TaxID=10195 RepID=A0A3M7PNI7_BRAPC|nr:hypothetical protein BpHYR1_031935 [Brachionus plicatilis]
MEAKSKNTYICFADLQSFCRNLIWVVQFLYQLIHFAEQFLDSQQKSYFVLRFLFLFQNSQCQIKSLDWSFKYPVCPDCFDLIKNCIIDFQVTLGNLSLIY